MQASAAQDSKDKVPQADATHAVPSADGTAAAPAADGTAAAPPAEDGTKPGLPASAVAVYDAVCKQRIDQQKLILSSK